MLGIGDSYWSYVITNCDQFRTVQHRKEGGGQFGIRVEVRQFAASRIFDGLCPICPSGALELTG